MYQIVLQFSILKTTIRYKNTKKKIIANKKPLSNTVKRSVLFLNPKIKIIKRYCFDQIN